MSMSIPAVRVTTAVGLGLGAIVLGVLVGRGVAAQDAGFGGRQGGRGGPGGPGMSALFTVLDVSRDGLLSADEISKAPAALKALDKNKDGRVSADELPMMGRGGREGFPGRGEVREGRGEGRGEGGDAPAPSPDELVATLMAFDKNHDGKISKDEMPERFQGLFDRADTNKDGLLTKDELTKSATTQAQSANAMAGRGEREREGGRERDDEREGGRGPMMMMDPLLSALDTDHDGALSAKEIAAAPAVIRKFDRNGDGSVSREELIVRGPGRATPSASRAGHLV